MVAFNDVGASRPSPAAKERTRESVPSFGPLGVEANATSSTTIVVRWGEVPKEHENGIIEGFKVYYGADSRSPFQYKDIPKNSTFTTTLTELRKYVTYHIQVLAYTRLGDGVLSIPPVRVLTFEDTPGPPSNVSFPDVSFTTARIIWDVPYDPNGEILAYVVTYHLNDDRESNFSREFPPSDRTYRATELQPEQYYMFSVRAQTRLGWGKTAHALVYTTNNREPPQAPSAPQVSSSQVQSEQITFSWTPGRDGFAPLRYYTVQRAEGPNGPWITVPERVDPQMTSYTVTELRPYTVYRFRIQATNDMGPSGWSQESPITRTLPAAPSRGVQNLKVVPITTTSVRVQWEPIAEQFWSGDHKTGGYKIVFQPVSHYPTALQASQAMQFPGVHTGEAVLGDLLRDCTYEIVVLPYNSQGLGPATPPATVYVGEAVPTGQPRDVTAEAVSSTEVRLSWRPPPAGQQNGELLGYKIFYVVIGHPAVENSNEATHVDSTEGAEQELEVVPAPSVSHSLVFLDQFTRYRVHIVAFNPAGDGPPSAPVTVTTLQGLPGPPANLTFTDITMTSLRVSWDPPVRRNGEILGYVVTYETAEQNDKFSKQVKQKVSGATSLAIQNLEEEVTYTFWVRAQTLDYGPATTANVTTGPQDGSPAPPRELLLARTAASTAIDLSWVNGPSGKGPILGYYMESKRKAVEEDLQIYDTRWQTVARTKNGPLTEFSVSYQNLLPSTSYMFRVIAYNRFGVSCPSYTNEEVLTPSKLYLDYGYLQYKPFYRQTWFMVALAASSIVIIIAIIAVLCVKSKSFKYKQEAAQKSMEETLRMEQDDSQDHPIEMYNQRSYRNFSQQLLGSVGRGKGRPPAVPMLGKSPPRPSPASVAYHSDEDSVKGYDENPDDSSVTEKPSELSSTDSQATDSDNDSEASAPHSFVNHYANVNDSLRQSWKRQRPAVRNYSSYTDSEPEPMGVSSHPGGSVAGSSAAAAASASTLNGGQIVMNNKARSRAPLPGFSSFV
ncbi:hypothetical protein B566_EDAN005493 [Ephemera danica]|nr:hypothetical protein B566_EDAN005493 [Ephemera danica]